VLKNVILWPQIQLLFENDINICLKQVYAKKKPIMYYKLFEQSLQLFEKKSSLFCKKMGDTQKAAMILLREF